VTSRAGERRFRPSCGRIEDVAIRDPAAMLAAQLEYLRSDERLRQRAALAAGMTPEERLEETAALGRWAMHFLDQLSDDERARALAVSEALPPDSEAILRRLSRLSSPGEDE
jgi:hypothetical protein